MSTQILAQSGRYRIEHEYESASVVVPGGARMVIGAFYGDPAAALIDADERWCAVAGEGLIVRSLAPGGACVEYFRQADATVWITGLRQTGPFALELQCEDGTVHVLDFGAACMSAYALAR
ncbi:hypothetical protein [Janthinobacterium psychrotolerans]|uniref:Uncharacterized protein n=1 Tax=Janthinobacterium psychrotolerans TaxID=1747903 RepID=A0A1A7C5Y6_9BURK|nr:hypothetical protein [Janthinobacterium psychrotolerans]OBV41122.1 hypothetical protein ASR47_102442 [Janthinobacterium psychrotolerans]